jgi:hypothetical protein
VLNAWLHASALNCSWHTLLTSRREWIRDFQVETLNFKPTGRRCAASSEKASDDAGMPVGLRRH